MESKHKEQYELIAEVCNTSVEHVYELAHGKHSKSSDDDDVLDMLAEKGIISIQEHKHKRHHRRKKSLFRRMLPYIYVVVLLAALLLAYLIYTSNDLRTPFVPDAPETPLIQG